MAPAPQRPRQSDQEVLERAFAAKNGAKVEALYRGDISAYDDDDSRAETVVRLIRMFCQDNAPVYLATAGRYRDWIEARPDLPPGSVISDTDEDQPNLGPITTPLRGKGITAGSPAHALWVLQRTLDWLATLPPAERAAADELAAACGASELLSLKLARPLSRIGNRLAVA